MFQVINPPSLFKSAETFFCFNKKKPDFSVNQSIFYLKQNYPYLLRGLLRIYRRMFSKHPPPRGPSDVRAVVPIYARAAVRSASVGHHIIPETTAELQKLSFLK